MSFSSGPQGGNAIIAPRYNTHVYSTILDFMVFSGNKFDLKKVIGPQMIMVTYVTTNPAPHPTFIFYLVGGSNSPTPEVLPMFPSTKTSYNYALDYSIDPSITPIGCTIESLPRPQNTTLINTFSVTETVTGLGYQLLFEFSPFGGVNPRFSLLNNLGVPPVDFEQFEIKNVFYRTVAADLRLEGTRISFMSPEIVTRRKTFSFLTDGFQNALDDGLAHSFIRYNGLQMITFTNTATNQFYSFSIDFGIISQGGGYLGYVSPTANAIPDTSIIQAVNCTVTTEGLEQPVVRTVVFRVTDLLGHVFLYTFDPNPYTQALPTIQLIGGLIGNVDISCFIEYRLFETC